MCHFEFKPFSEHQGWQCPGCSRCYAPSVLKCWSCGEPQYSWPNSTEITTTTGLTISNQWGDITPITPITPITAVSGNGLTLTWGDFPPWCVGKP